ncbi:MAG: radical SAM protein [Planctomycetota bacterium]
MTPPSRHIGQTDGPRPLRLLFWESTARCNLACVHCRRLDPGQAQPDELTTAQVKSVLDSAATLGMPIIVFSGGEPLMRNDWQELADYARSLSLPTALATNGTLVDARIAEQIRNAGFRRVSISFDGADAAAHDAFRGVDGAFAQAMAGAAHLRAAAVPLQVNATIAAHNDQQLDEIYALAGQIGAEALHLFLLVPVGCGVQIGPSHQLPPDRYEAVLNWIVDRQQSGSMEIKATCAPHYYRIAAQRGLDTGHSRGCLGGISVAFLSHVGQVFPCGYLPVECGDVTQTPLADIWRDSAVLADLRDYDKLQGACGRCGYKGICGGCRARACAATGNYLGPEPSCKHGLG